MAPAERSSEDGAYLVLATYHPPGKKLVTKAQFPLFTVRCEHPEDAIEIVLRMGFCFSRGCWTLTAVYVDLLG